MKRSRFWILLVVVLVMLLMTSSIASAHSRANPRVIPPNAVIKGLTYGEWIAKWWDFGLTLPIDENPIIGGTDCAVKRIGKVGLVIANSMLDVPIQCEVPVGMMLFFEVLGSECSTLEAPPFYGSNEEELRTCAQAFYPHDLEASIDGQELANLEQYIATSPMFEFTAPENNVLGVPAGTIGKSVGYGAYVMIAPLSPGKHTLHFHGTYPDFAFTADRTFDLTVGRKH